MAAVLFAGALWFGLSARSAYSNLTASRDDLVAAQDAIAATDLAAAQQFLTDAADHAEAAAGQVNGPLWDLAAAVPVLGDTPEAVQAVATSLDQALSSLAPAVGVLGDLDPETLVTDGSTINVAALQNAVEPLEAAQAGVAQATQTLGSAPSKADGARVPGSIDDAATQLADQLTQLDDTLANATQVATLVPPLLGVDGPKRYLVPILNPNEARGTGGFLGTYAIISADQGRITVEKIGSNPDLPNVPETPPELGAQYIKRYGSGERLTPNFNISPHNPAAGLLWVKSWEEKTGEVLDGTISADVVALGDLVTATGEEVTLPDGTSLTGEELTYFAIQGIYEQFPDAADRPARKAFQEAVTKEAFDVVTTSTQGRTALASAIAQALTERRIQIWATDEALQQQVLDAGIGGTLAVPDGHNITFVAINTSAAKLDAFLERSLTYQVGRCPDPNSGRVYSTMTVGLTSAIPEGREIPNYVAGARRGPDGPINSTLAQLYLPLGAEVLEVLVDGKSSSYQTFKEQDRAAVVLALTLPPREERTIEIQFSEPADDGPATAPQQPLGSDQETTIVDVNCGESNPAAEGTEPDPSDTADPLDDPFGPLVPLGGGSG